MATLSSASGQTEPNPIATQTSAKLLREGQWLGLFLIGHVLLAVIYSLVIPPWEAHDEWAHYRYAAYIAENRSLPDPNERLTTEFLFDEASQPPLYYLLAAVPMLAVNTVDAYRPAVNPYATRGTGEGGVNFVLHDDDVEGWPWQGTILALHLGRFISVLISTAGLYITYVLVRLLSLPAPSVALVAVGLQAFAPQYVFLSAVMTNDILLIVLETLFLYLCVRLVLEGPSPRGVLLLAFVSGLALLTKYLALIVIPLAIVVVLTGAWVHRHEPGQRRNSIVNLAVLVTIVLSMSGILVGRNLIFTGALIPRDPTSQQAVLSSLLGIEGLNLDLSTLPDALSYGFETYWVSFGWGNVGAPDWVYTMWLMLTLVGVAGTIIWIRKDMPKRMRPVIAILLLFVVFVIALPLFRELIHQSSYLRGRYILATLPLTVWAISQGWARLSGRAWKWVRHGLVMWPALLTLTLIPMIITPSYALPSSVANQPSETAHPVNARFGDVAELISVDLGSTKNISVGQGLPVTLTWKTLGRSAVPYTLSIHVVGAGSESYGSTTSYPGHGNAATTVWQPGIEFTETYWVLVEDKGPTPALGRIAITLSSEDAATSYLPVFDAMNQRVGSTVRVGQFRIDRQQPSNDISMSDDVLARFGDLLLLTHAYLPTTDQKPGWSLPVVLRWQTLSAGAHDTKLSIQLLDADGNWVLGSDGNPSETLPPELWRAGDTLHATRWLNLPDNLAPGKYTVIIALYHASDLTRIATYDRLGNTLESNAHSLGTITVSTTPASD
ncbi:MAG: DUF2142 domain-containing protein [Chloroflexi bacterium]|nr:DUF2142 domain-containing protein [Chloroflexota bacterium]